MPKKSNSRKAESTENPVMQRIERRPSAHKSHAWLFLLLFLSVAIISYIIYQVYNQQIKIGDLVEKLSSGAGQPLIMYESETVEYQFSETGVAGYHLAYRPCPQTFTGACDDAMLYEIINGSKQVIIPSLRALSGSPRTSELLQPLVKSDKWLVLGAWSYGSRPNENDKRIWIYDFAKGDVILQTDRVPSSALFSPDYQYAAYAVKDNDDIKDLTILSMKDEDYAAGAKAGSGQTFMSSSGDVEMRWLDDKNLAINVFTLPDDENNQLEFLNEKQIKVK
ncbi:MAG: hypothetical protein ACOYUZ_05485 [Patescibacteria group bacterium]